MIAPAPAQTPSIAEMIGCGQARMDLTTSPVILVKSSSSTVFIFVSGSMISNTSPPEQKLPPDAGDDDRLDDLVPRRGAEQIDDLGIAVEGQRVLLVRAVQGQRRDLAVHGEIDMSGLVAEQRQRDGIGRAHDASPFLSALRAESLVLASSGISASMSFGARPAKISPTQSALMRAMLRKNFWPSGGQADDLDAAILGRRPAVDQPLLGQPVDQTGDVAVRHHHALRQLAERHAVRRAVELRQQIEPRQRDVETDRAACGAPRSRSASCR